MQLALPCLLYAPAASKLILRGGTNAEMAPPVDFMTDVSCQSLFMPLQCHINATGMSRYSAVEQCDY